MKLLITGATGYIGSMLIKHLLRNKNSIEIVAPVRDIAKACDMLPDGVKYYEIDFLDNLLGDASWITQRIFDRYDYIIHCACVTSSSEMITRPVETTASILKITENILKIAGRCKKSGSLKSMVFLSSMEVYGHIDCSDGHRAVENESGFINPLDARSCYPMGKRMAENLCYSYFKEYGVPVKIARLAQTFGHGVPLADMRVFSQFANAAAYGNDIVLHTEGTSMGNYCGIDDVVKGIITILEHGRNGEAYNVVNEKNTMTIREMAELVADRIAEGRIRVVYDILISR